MNTFLRVLRLGRRHLGSFLAVALLASAGTAATLVEPWIYSAIIDDVAGVLVASGPVATVERALDRVAVSVQHWPGALGRILSPPMVPFNGAPGSRRLESRQPSEAAATVILGALILVSIRLVAEAFKRIGDNRATRSEVVIYRIPEPAVGDSTSENADVFRAAYDDGPRDAESAFVTSDGAVFVVTKDNPTRLYRLRGPLRPNVRLRLSRVADIPTESATGQRLRRARIFWLRVLRSSHGITRIGGGSRQKWICIRLPHPRLLWWNGLRQRILRGLVR